MSFASWLVGGLLATLVLTAVLSASMGFGLTRLSFPSLLGTMLTPDRDNAMRAGLGLHALNGWVFALVYVGLFHAIGRSGWWLGAIAGAVHGLLVLALVLPALPSWHPRMASLDIGSTVVRQLEPPGFGGRHYGNRTPELTLLAHVLYGLVLGAVYRI